MIPRSRELQFKVKGISMSLFTADDVADVAAGGNTKHNGLYMARYHLKEFSLPNGSDVVKLREFIKSKYNDKKWYGNGENNSRNENGHREPEYSSSDSGSNLWGKKQSSTSFASQGIIAVKVCSIFISYLLHDRSDNWNERQMRMKVLAVVKLSLLTYYLIMFSSYSLTLSYYDFRCTILMLIFYVCIPI